MAAAKSGRNAPCPCGSGRKYKQCCAGKRDRGSRLGTYALVAVLVAIAGVLVYTFTADGGSGPRQVWDPAHGHYHTVP